MIMGTMLSLQKVTKIYPGAGHIKAVDELSFDLEEGEICTFVGPSGCGKSTAMKMINRLISITSGKIFIDGKNISNLNTITLRRKIGYVIQTIGLFPHMTVEKNISVVPRLLKWSREKIRRRVSEMLELVGLNPDQYSKKSASELSGGEAQRVGVARALAGDPPILLMDEPFGAVDPINREVLQESFMRIQRELKKTIVFVTHDMDEALKMADIVAVMQQGRLIKFDTPLNILSQPKNAFVKSFFGNDRVLKRLAMMNALDYIIDKESGSALRYTVEKEETFSLKDALTRLLEEQTETIRVKDVRSGKTGLITLEMIKQFAVDDDSG